MRSFALILAAITNANVWAADPIDKSIQNPYAACMAKLADDIVTAAVDQTQLKIQSVNGLDYGFSNYTISSSTKELVFEHRSVARRKQKPLYNSLFGDPDSRPSRPSQRYVPEKSLELRWKWKTEKPHTRGHTSHGRRVSVITDRTELQFEYQARLFEVTRSEFGSGMAEKTYECCTVDPDVEITDVLSGLKQTFRGGNGCRDYLPTIAQGQRGIVSNIEHTKNLCSYYNKTLDSKTISSGNKEDYFREMTYFKGCFMKNKAPARDYRNEIDSNGT